KAGRGSRGLGTHFGSSPPLCRQRIPLPKCRTRTCALLVRCCCSLERELSALSYSQSALDVWSWSSLRMSSKHSICFLGCSGDRIIASVTTSTSEVLFLVSRCFLLGTCFMR